MDTQRKSIDEIWAFLDQTGRLIEALRDQSKETDRRLEEQSVKTDKKIDQVTKTIGQLGNRLGDFVEEMVRPALVNLFRQRGIEVHEVHRGLSAHRDDVALEVDLLVVDDEVCVAVEVNSHLLIDDVNIERLGQFKRAFSHYRSMRLHGAVAAMVIAENVARYASRKGLFVLVQSGESVAIANDRGFQPSVW